MDKKTLQTEILEAAYQPEKWLEVLKLWFGVKLFGNFINIFLFNLPPPGITSNEFPILRQYKTLAAILNPCNKFCIPNVL